MINLTLLREEPARIKELILKKEPSFPVDQFIQLDDQVKSIRSDIEGLRHRKNELAEAGKAGVTDQIRQESIKVGKSLKELEQKLEAIQSEFEQLYLNCPNLLFDDVPPGNKERNVTVKVIGKKPEFNFPIKNHLELGESLDGLILRLVYGWLAVSFLCTKVWAPS